MNTILKEKNFKYIPDTLLKAKKMRYFTKVMATIV